MLTEASKEQVRYANILNAGMLVGLSSLAVAFILYISGILHPLIPIKQVEKYWVISVRDYLEKSGMEAGWAWIANLSYGDMLNLLPIAFLSLLSIICYLAILPELIRKRDTAYVLIAITEIIVLLVAASGLLGTGGH